MNCPRCEMTLNISQRQSVEIDVCPQCRGVWLDRGELDKIIERYDAYDDRDRRYEGHSGYRGKKKEHWLGELFG